jgi:hypothetical protein
MVEDGVAIAEDEIDVPGNVAVGKILTCRNAVLAIWSTVAATGVHGVLSVQS